MTMKCAYSNAELGAAYCGHTDKHYTWASRGLVNVKSRKQIICIPSFEREIILVRL